MLDLHRITLSLLRTVLLVVLTIFLLFQVSLERLWVMSTWQRLGCSFQRNTSIGVRRKQCGVYSSWFGVLWISLEQISKLGFQNATLRKAGRALWIKNKGLEYILCSPARQRAVCGGGRICSMVGFLPTAARALFWEMREHICPDFKLVTFHRLG